MGYNHGKAVAEFRRRWRKLLRYYRDHGLTYEQIFLVYKADKQDLFADRRYYEHICDLEPEYADIVMPMDEPDTYTEQNWIEVLPDALRAELVKQPKDHLRAFYLYRVAGFSTQEISVVLHRPVRTIQRWIKQIAEMIDNYR